MCAVISILDAAWMRAIAIPRPVLVAALGCMVLSGCGIQNKLLRVLRDAQNTDVPDPGDELLHCATSGFDSTMAVARMSSATRQKEPDSYASMVSYAGIPSARPSSARATNSEAEKERPSHTWKSSSVTTVVQSAVSAAVVSHSSTPSVAVRPRHHAPGFRVEGQPQPLIAAAKRQLHVPDAQ
jgi:hypothetical protein